MSRPPGEVVVKLAAIALAAKGGGPPMTSLDLEIREGEAIVVAGRNGSGKSRLLRVLADLEEPASGLRELFGMDPLKLRYGERRALRARIGFVFDQGGTWDNRTLYDNIALPLHYHNPREPAVTRMRTEEIAIALGIEDGLEQLASHADESLCKRTLFARALAQEPDLLLVDEPQLMLTRPECKLVSRAIEERRQSRNMTVIYVDHDGWVDPYRMDRAVLFSDGKLEPYQPTRSASLWPGAGPLLNDLGRG